MQESITPVCERNISFVENSISTRSYQANHIFKTQAKTVGQRESVSIYNTTPEPVTRTLHKPHQVRWTKSGKIVSPEFNVHYVKLSQFATLSRNWDDCVSPPTPAAVRHAHQALQILADFDFPPNGVVLSGEGGVGITFRRTEKYADLEFFNDGEAMSAIHLRDGISEPLIEDMETTIVGIQSTIEKIIEFLRLSD